MEEQENLETIRIGSKEAIFLKPAKVKIVKVSIETLGDKGAKKVICEVSHPDKTDGNIKISSIKYENRGKLDISGIWFNKDEDGMIRKGSALATFLNFLNANSVSELNEKEIETIQDDKNYLIFKCY